MAYTKKVWKDYPDTTTPILASDMNNIEDGIETLDTSFSGLLNFFYPVGTIYETTSTNLDTTTKMANHFGGTWEVYGAGRVLVAKSADTEFDTIGETGGAKTVTLTAAQSGLPAHNHPILYGSSAGGNYPRTTPNSSTDANSPTTNDAVKNNAAANAAEAHTNLQPYIVVYRYRRTA